MDTSLIIFLAILTASLVAAGIIFCIVPPLPGPMVSYLALLSYECMPGVAGFSVWTYIIWAVVVVLVTVADLIFPPAVTRRFGGTGGAVWGGSIGALAGLFFPPFGIVLGPLAGAIAGDLLGGNHFRAAMKSGFGSFAGFIAATAAKVAVCMGIGGVVAIRGAINIWEMFGS
jgi:uncharacterized protein YqgC (DUF456 family)